MSYATSDGKPIDLEHLLACPAKRVIPIEEVREAAWYEDMADLAEIFNHEVIEDQHGVWRWRANGLINLIDQHAPVYTPSGAECHTLNIHPYTKPHTKEFRASLNLNCLHMDLKAGLFTLEEFMKFYMQIGYSLSGYIEVFGQKEAAEFGLDGAKTWDDGENHDEYCETVIEYMLRVHEGTVLKL